MQSMAAKQLLTGIYRLPRMGLTASAKCCLNGMANRSVFTTPTTHVPRGQTSDCIDDYRSETERLIREQTLECEKVSAKLSKQFVWFRVVVGAYAIVYF